MRVTSRSSSSSLDAAPVYRRRCSSPISSARTLVASSPSSRPFRAKERFGSLVARAPRRTRIPRCHRQRRRSYPPLSIKARAFASRTTTAAAATTSSIFCIGLNQRRRPRVVIVPLQKCLDRHKSIDRRRRAFNNTAAFT